MLLGYYGIGQVGGDISIEVDIMCGYKGYFCHPKAYLGYLVMVLN